MTDRDRAMLAKQVEGTADTIAQYVAQIESGEYGNRWDIYNSDDDRIGTVFLTDEDAERLRERSEEIGNRIERDEFDEPTIADEYGNESPISEYPLEIVDERGREFAVVITVGGPHIEVVADGGQNARLVGYWGGETVTYHGDVYSTFLDYFIERD